MVLLLRGGGERKRRRKGKEAEEMGRKGEKKGRDGTEGGIPYFYLATARPPTGGFAPGPHWGLPSPDPLGYSPRMKISGAAIGDSD